MKLNPLSPALLLLASRAAAETVHGVVVFSRHGDRTTKWYGAQSLTALGAEQNHLVGSDFRKRYLESGSDHQILGISEDEYVSAQVLAHAPDQGILLNTATSFLQGLYPPLSEIAPDKAVKTLNDGTKMEAPISGYQYVVLHGVNDDSADTIWIKGDDDCAAYKNSSKSFEKSAVFADRDRATRDFYSGFYDELSPGVYNLKPENMTYKNAYNIFDLVNVARIHNATSAARNVSDQDLDQLRTLADSAELGLNYNASEPDRSIGAETLAGAIFQRLNTTVSNKAKTKFMLMAGSYDTFLAFFGLSGLLDVSPDFHGLPEYAATMAFELVSDSTDKFPEDPTEDMRVRFLFRNGTAGNLTAFPLFGLGEEALPWKTFETEMTKRAIVKVEQWCDRCKSDMDFCLPFVQSDDDDDDDESKGGSSETGKTSGSGSSLSLPAAGAIGGVLGLVVAAVVFGAILMMMRKKQKKQEALAQNETSQVRGQKDRQGSDGGSSSNAV